MFRAGGKDPSADAHLMMGTMITCTAAVVRSLHAPSLTRCSRWPVRLPPCSQRVPKLHRQRRTCRRGHRSDGIADVAPVERLVHGKLSRPRRLPQPGRVSRGDPVRARRHPSHLPGDAALRHLLPVGRDGLRRHHDLRPRGVQPAVGPVGRRYLGHRADRPERIDRRQWTAGPRWVSSTRRAKNTTGACSRRRSSRSPGRTARQTSA